MGLNEELQKVVDDLKKIVTVSQETQAKIDELKRLEESRRINKGI